MMPDEIFFSVIFGFLMLMWPISGWICRKAYEEREREARLTGAADE